MNPHPHSAVLGGATGAAPTAAVWGGLAAARHRINSNHARQKLAALLAAAQYPEAELELLLAGLGEPDPLLRRTAYLRLWHRPEPEARAALEGLWPYEFFDVVHTFSHGDRSVVALALAPDGRCLYSACGDGMVYRWELTGGLAGQGQPLATEHQEDIRCLSLSADGTLLVTGSRDRTICLWRTDTHQLLRTLRGHQGYINSVAIAPDGQTLISGSQDTTIRIWHLPTGAPLRTLRGHTNLVDAVALSPDGTRIASCSWDTTIRVWDVATGTQIWELIGHSARVLSFAIANDGRTLVSGSLDTRIKIWDLDTGTEIATLDGHRGWVRALTLSQDDRVLVSASYKTIKVWDLQRGIEHVTLHGHRSLVEAIALSPDHHTLITGGEDGNIHLWQVPHP